jgi:hypothetical protein
MPAHRSAFPHVPRARLDPLTGIIDVLAVVELAVTRPLAAETVALFLDAARRGCGLTVVTGTAAADAVLEVASCLSQAVAEIDEIDSVVLTSIRPGGSLMPGDVERWSELRLLVADHGIDLLDWIVVGRQGPELPRALAGGVDPWLR